MIYPTNPTCPLHLLSWECSKLWDKGVSFPSQVYNAWWGDAEKRIQTVLFSLGCALAVHGISLIARTITPISEGPKEYAELIAGVAWVILGACLVHVSGWECSSYYGDVFFKAIFDDWRFEIDPPFVEGQPIGLPNYSGTDCCVNAPMQLLMNSPHFLERACRISEIDQFREKYFQAKTEKKSVLRSSFFQWDMLRSSSVQLVREFLEKEKWIESGQDDASNVFVRISDVIGGICCLKQEADRQSSREQQEWGICLEIGDRGNLFKFKNENTFEKYLERFFINYAESSQCIQLFFPSAPEDLFIWVKRFKNNLQKQCEDVPVPLDFTLPKRYIKKGDAQNYTCDGFIVHYGGLSSGHYIAYVKNEENKWWECDDARLTSKTEAEVLQLMPQGYIYHFSQTEVVLPVALSTSSPRTSPTTVHPEPIHRGFLDLTEQEVDPTGSSPPTDSPTGSSPSTASPTRLSPPHSPNPHPQ